MENEIKIKVKDLWFYYHQQPVLKNINIEIESNKITSISGPSGQGKSTFLMTLNRLWENIPGTKVHGSIKINFNNRFEDIFHKSLPLPLLRRKVGMVFQTPNPLPMGIYKNIAFPLKLMGEKNRELNFLKVKSALKKAFLWDEVKERLSQDAGVLSGGQQQRLCMARTLVLKPEVLLLDEPTSSLDETSGRIIEELLLELKKKCTIILVSHYMDQVKRISDNRLILSEGQLKKYQNMEEKLG